MHVTLEELIDCIASLEPVDWSLFPAIPLYKEQVVTVLDGWFSSNRFGNEKGRPITADMINNYVKQGYVSKPINKRYNKEHLVFLNMLVQLKAVLPIQLLSRGFECLFNNMTSEEKYQKFATHQREAIDAVIERIKKQVQNSEEDETNTGLLAFQLALEANLLRMAAEKLLSTETARLRDSDAENIQ